MRLQGESKISLYLFSIPCALTIFLFTNFLSNIPSMTKHTQNKKKKKMETFFLMFYVLWQNTVPMPMIVVCYLPVNGNRMQALPIDSN